jgi:tRNA pseudouridine38-40 synthase
VRTALILEYDGAAYRGWQAQTHAPSVQDMVERALAAIAAAPVRVHVAGRTDTGVHATGQVAHFDAPVARPRSAWVLGTNTHLPADVRIRAAHEVPQDFHARFSALARAYRYVIHNRAEPTALWRARAWQVPEPLDVSAMRAAAAALLGEHDFSAFRAAGCQSRSPKRVLQRLDVSRHGPWVVVDAQANAFLLHMVRNLVGFLVAVGRGRRGADAAGVLLAGRDRRLAPPTAPAQGLYLTGVHYPARYGLVPPPPDDLPGGA